MQSPQKFDQHKSEKIADFGFKVYLFIWVKISTIKSNCQSIQRVFIVLGVCNFALPLYRRQT